MPKQPVGGRRDGVRVADEATVAAERVRESTEVLRQEAARILERYTEEIVVSWIASLEREAYAGRPGPNGEALRAAAPALVDGVVAVLCGEPPSVGAPWAAAVRRYAVIRLVQGLTQSELAREFQLLRRAMWRTLRRRLDAAPSQGVFDLAEALDGAFGVMNAVSVRIYHGDARDLAARLLDLAHGQLEAVLRQMPSGVIIAAAPSGRLLLCNEQAARIWGHPLPLLAAIEDYTAWEGYHPDGRPYRPQEWPLSRSLSQGQVVTNEEIRIRRGDGEWGWISASSAPVCDDQGRIATAVMVFADIGRRKQAEALLERYRLLFRHAHEAILFIDPRDGRILEANEAAARTYGYAPDQLLSLSVYDLLATDEAFRAPEEVPAPLQGVRYETVHRRHDGSTFPVEVSSVSAPWNGWTVLLSIIRDISERRRAQVQREEALAGAQQAQLEAERASEHISRILESISDAFFALDAEGRFTYVNQRAAAIWGLNRDELIGRNLWEVFTSFAGDGLLRQYRRVVSRREPSVSEYYYAPNDLWLQIRAYPADGGISVYFEDITERKKAEAERERLLEDLRQANERLVSASIREQELAGEAERRAMEAENALRLREDFLNVAAHELKTPLTSLRGQAELTMRRIEQGRLESPEQFHRALEVIDRQADRLSILVTQLLDISRIESGELQLDRRMTDLVPLTRTLLETQQARTDRHTLTLQAPPTLPANVDGLRLEEVLYNLIDNAIRYSPQGGPVEVELGTPQPGMVRIAVRGHGIGVPPEQRERLFTRFFQASRRPAGGLGLGLYISRRIVQLHGGHIWAEFPEDGGSRFIVTLPRDGPEGSGRP